MKRDSLFDHMKEPISKNNNSTTTVFSSSSQEVEKLSSDLSLLLSNPNLTKSLSDGSLDLISYSQVVQKELSNLESECIAIYHQKSHQIASLRDEIDGCDGVLTSLQEMLLGFQADLGGLSSDIRMLQDQSHTLEVQLRNRKAAESALRKFLERIVIPPNLADVICHREVDVVFMECVRELNEKYAYVHGNDVADQRSSIGGVGNESEEKLQEQEEEDDLISGVSPRDTIAGREMKTHIDKLRLKAVARTREFFLAKIAELRRPKTNVRMIQINSLLKYAPLNEFLAHGAPDVYMEVRDAYVESMSKTLHALFRTYQAQLSRVDSQIATRHDFLIAVEDAALRDVFSTKVNLNKRGDTFFLGERSSVLDLVQNHARPILAHVALARGERYPYEMIFRSVMTHLMDSVTNEHVFTHDFFSAGNKAAAANADSNDEKLTLASIRTESFVRTLSLVLEQLENYLFNCYDCLALLLMIKITHANRRIMKSRKIFILDEFLSRITMLLWPRLKMVMDAQLRSIRSANAKRLGGVELHAHYISRRYAEFTSSILLILNKGRRKMQSSQHAHHQHSAKKAARSRPSKPSTSEDKDHMDQDSNSKQPSSLQRITSVKSTDTSNTAPPSPSNPLSTKKSNSAGDMLMNDLSLILDETVQLLERLADESLKSNKRKIVFLINNLDQIITIFQERRIVGREMNRFVELLMQQRELFVEEELLQNYSKIIAFVQQTESHISRQGPGSAGSHTRMELNEAVVENLVLDFKLTWKKGIEDINRNVLSYFSNFRNGMEILKQSLTQLLLYYTRFQDIIRKTWRSKPPAWCKDLVSTTVILGEIKKYALSI